MANDRETVTIEDARIVYKNFAGAKSQFNAAGKREFSVILDEVTAEGMLADGYNVKRMKAREEGDPETPFITIEVSYKVRPPRVFMKSSTARTPLTEATVEMLDWADIASVDVVITPYDWELNGKTGRKAYLKTLWAMIEEDDLDRKHGGVEDFGHGD